LPLAYFGTPPQKERYLRRLASGDLIAAYALTEPQSGSDALAARIAARLASDGPHYLLNGQKMWITNGQFADLFMIVAKVDGDTFTGFLVERSMGVVSGGDEIKLGLDGNSMTALMATRMNFTAAGNRSRARTTRSIRRRSRTASSCYPSRRR
jgi:alkylation response protein AidB-like acyl-CoA dehydrogenase